MDACLEKLVSEKVSTCMDTHGWSVYVDLVSAELVQLMRSHLKWQELNCWALLMGEYCQMAGAANWWGGTY